MNYIFRKAKDRSFVAHVKIEEWRRPSKGTQLKLPVSNKTWEVMNVEPASNPAGQSNTYLIEEV